MIEKKSGDNMIQIDRWFDYWIIGLNEQTLKMTIKLQGRFENEHTVQIIILYSKMNQTE